MINGTFTNDILYSNPPPLKESGAAAIEMRALAI